MLALVTALTMNPHSSRLFVLFGSGVLAASNFPVSASEEVTFAEHIAPIVYENCTVCHRPGEAAPFSFTDYNSVKRRARTIQRVVIDEGYMPPWHPEKGWGEFRGTRRLTPEQKDLIGRWVAAGAPEGDPALTPALPEFPEGWHLGKPDLVVEMDEDFEIHAEGNDIYRYFALPLNLSEDKWVRAVEVRPAVRSVVHHVLFFLDNTGKARTLQQEDQKAAGFSGKGFKATGSLGGWAVGGTPLELPEGHARPLPKGSDLVLQTHFHPTGKVEREKTRIGIYFADTAPERRLLEFQVPPNFGSPVGITIAPGDSEYVVEDHLIIPEDTDLISVWGHAHQVCTSMQAEATLPDGTKQRLFRIGGWDFNWQGQYAYEEPLRLPKGTQIDARITYDNSAENSSNPNTPPKRIYWGEQSTDEMGSLIFQCVAAEKGRQAELAQGLNAQARESKQRFEERRRLAIRTYMVMRLDENADDVLSKDEVPAEYAVPFTLLDQDGSKTVTVAEIEKNGAFLDEMAKKKKPR